MAAARRAAILGCLPALLCGLLWGLAARAETAADLALALRLVPATPAGVAHVYTSGPAPRTLRLRGRSGRPMALSLGRLRPHTDYGILLGRDSIGVAGHTRYLPLGSDLQARVWLEAGGRFRLRLALRRAEATPGSGGAVEAPTLETLQLIGETGGPLGAWVPLFEVGPAGPARGVIRYSTRDLYHERLEVRVDRLP